MKKPKKRSCVEEIVRSHMRRIIEGGPGSGYFDHPGRPGEVGGSTAAGARRGFKEKPPKEGGGGGSGGEKGKSSGGTDGKNHVGETGKYFDKHERHNKDLGHSIMLQTWSRDLGHDQSQQITTYKSKESGKEGTYWARVLGGYKGSLNTWGGSQGHKTEKEAVDAAILKVKKIGFLHPLSEKPGKPAPYIYPD